MAVDPDRDMQYAGLLTHNDTHEFGELHETCPFCYLEQRALAFLTSTPMPDDHESAPQHCGMDMYAWEVKPGVTLWRCSHRAHHPMVIDIGGLRVQEEET